MSSQPTERTFIQAVTHAVQLLDEDRHMVIVSKERWDDLLRLEEQKNKPGIDWENRSRVFEERANRFEFELKRLREKMRELLSE